MPLIELKNTAFSYDKHTVIEGLNFSVVEGDYLCVLGTNGSGKSTLLKGILGLIGKYGGEISFSSSLKHSEIGYLPQQTAVQKDFPASVWEVVLSGCLSRLGNRPFYGSKEKLKAEKIMRRLGIWDIHKCSFPELSGGQCQRALLARALCAAEKLLLLDEPVAGLDPVVTAQMYEMLESLNKEEKMTIIMVSHDVDVAKKGANKILHLAHRQMFFGTSEEYLKTELAKHYLGGCGH